jgi:hypothetical protein
MTTKQHPGQFLPAENPGATVPEDVRVGPELVYTKYGNMPREALGYQVVWETSEEGVVLIERYFFRDEIVRQAPHVFLNRGIQTAAEAGL